jgi:hypothetical protein
MPTFVFSPVSEKLNESRCIELPSRKLSLQLRCGIRLLLRGTNEIGQLQRS